LRRYLELDDEKGRFLDNADWLLELRHADFLRDIGRHFRVNEMLRAESYRARMEREEGLSFIEFNYQLLQAYDFLRLHQDHGCNLQIGGDDQWGNILAGTDLIRRLGGGPAFGFDLPLLTTASGAKMGKTASGCSSGSMRSAPPPSSSTNTGGIRTTAMSNGSWRISPSFRWMRFASWGSAKGPPSTNPRRFWLLKRPSSVTERMRQARAREAAKVIKGTLAETLLPATRLKEGIGLLDLLVEVGLCPSKAEARRLVQQGARESNGEPAADPNARIGEAQIEGGAILLQAGKKFHKLVIQ